MGGKGSGGARSNSGARMARMDKVDGELNTRIIEFGKVLMSKFELVDLNDVNAMRERFFEYLDLCEEWKMKPTLSSACMAFGLDRRRFWEIANGMKRSFKGYKLTPETEDFFKKVYDFLEMVLTNVMLDSKGNPATAIFLAKNHFGYKDVSEQVVHRVDDRLSLKSAEEVAAEYSKRLGKSPGHLLEAEVVEVVDAD